MITRFTTAIEPSLLSEFDAFIRRHGYRNRSEAIRDVIRKGLVDEQWERATGEAIGVVSLVYAHGRHQLQDRLADVQHAAHELVISTTHVHLDAETCLEVVLARGPAARVKALADRLIALRGVQRGALHVVGAKARGQPAEPRHRHPRGHGRA